MALAKPCIISSKVGCQGDLVIDGHNGYIFEVGSSESLEACIRKMLVPENYKILQANTIELSKKFDDAVQINQMLEFFKNHL